MRVLKVTAEKDDLWVRFNNYKVFKEILKWKLLKQGGILNFITMSVKKPETKSISMENEKRMLERPNEELLRKYNAQIPVK